MRSEALACVVVLALWGSAAAAAQPAAAPTRAQVASEVETLRQTLEVTRTEKTLRFKDDAKKKREAASKSDSSTWGWLREFARWMTEAGRVAVWVGLLLVVALIVVSLRHWVKVRAGGIKGTATGPLPSHVRDLDIRPESLPRRIGEAAAALWQQGEHRAALSLLYRGALSRLVHQHRVPIRAASTEGECLALAAQRLAPERSAYFGRLVEAWQVAVYGGRLPDADSVIALCRDFDLQFRDAGAGA